MDAVTLRRGVSDRMADPGGGVSAPTAEDGMCSLRPPFWRYPRADAGVALQGGPRHSPELTGGPQCLALPMIGVMPGAQMIDPRVVPHPACRPLAFAGGQAAVGSDDLTLSQQRKVVGAGLRECNPIPIPRLPPIG